MDFLFITSFWWLSPLLIMSTASKTQGLVAHEILNYSETDYMAWELLYLFSYLTLPTAISISNKSVYLRTEIHKTGSFQSERDF